MPQTGFVVWFTGLSGAGKSTLASMLASKLIERGVHVETLDGDEVRMHLSKGLGFSKEDRDTSVRRIGFVAKLIARSGGCAITASISPYRDVREEQRQAIGRFCEVFCSATIAALSERDPKGLYQKALAGEIKNFTGVSDPYEPPHAPDVTVYTDRESKEQSLATIMAKLEELGFIEQALGGAADPCSELRGLPAPHGGELVDRWARATERDGMVARAASAPSIVLDARAAADLECLAIGAFSPLRGFMTSKDYLRVVRESRLERGVVWPIPVTLAVSREQADGLAEGSEVALCMPDGRVVGVLELSDKYTPDKELEAREVYGTSDRAHPGVAYLFNAGEVYLGGEVRVLERPTAVASRDQQLDPRAMRELFESRGWSRVVGFQTRNPMHRAHEYITKCALEMCDALLVHPTVGPAKDDDVPVAVRMKSYEVLLARYYAPESVVLSGYPGAMRFAGPREAVLHALIRKNYGCSHFIVGRDHAGVGSFYEPGAAERLFASFAPMEIGITPLSFENVFYSRRTDAMATRKTAPDRQAAEPAPSGSKVRELMTQGQLPPAHWTRPEVADILAAALKRE
jgi:ATP sulfurylase/adenylyl-sulfate kinase